MFSAILHWFSVILFSDQNHLWKKNVTPSNLLNRNYIFIGFYFLLKIDLLERGKIICRQVIPLWQLIVHTSSLIYVNFYLTDLKMLLVKGWRFVLYVRIRSRQTFQTVTSRSMSLATLGVSVHSVTISWITAQMRISNATSTNTLINDTMMNSLMIQWKWFKWMTISDNCPEGQHRS